MMELSGISEGLLCPGAILEEDLIDTEIRIIDPETGHCLLIPCFDSLLQFADLSEEITALID